ncbi:MAG: DUF4153 domain-containing protein [Alistipes sp.]|jgi:hypothetical protein|nr:DUF4153 domain-containing protein [Alistipes sp.]
MMFSPGAIAGSLYTVVRRFPVAVAALLAGAVLMLLVVHGHEDAIDYRWWVFLPAAMLASVAGVLAGVPAAEDRRSHVIGLIAELGVPLLWGVRCLFLPVTVNELTGPQWVEIGVVDGAGFVAIFFAPFLRRDTDAQWWNFSARLVVRLALGALFSGILFGGFLLAIHAVAELFRVDPPEELFGWLAVCCFIVFAPLYVMAGVPGGEAKQDGELRPRPVLKVLSLYILVPILAVYTSILYLYLFKIVLTWELPDGWVAWLVTTLAVGGLVVTLLLWPLRMRGGNRAAELLGRWTGVIIAPLLILMTVGIARRVSDYGLTPNRCYMLLLNVWFYGVYAWLFVVRGRRVKWIVVSAVVVALLSSVGPWSLARVNPRPADIVPLDMTERVMDGGEWFSSDNAVEANSIVPLDGNYSQFARIVWYRHSPEDSDRMTVTEQDGDLVIRPVGGERGFRLPLDRVTDSVTIRGDGFIFYVGACNGTRYPDSGTVEVNHIEGYLFFNN